jgi:hypothetical protein
MSRYGLGRKTRLEELATDAALPKCIEAAVSLFNELVTCGFKKPTLFRVGEPGLHRLGK